MIDYVCVNRINCGFNQKANEDRNGNVRDSANENGILCSECYEHFNLQETGIKKYRKLEKSKLWKI